MFLKFSKKNEQEKIDELKKNYEELKELIKRAQAIIEKSEKIIEELSEEDSDKELPKDVANFAKMSGTVI